MSNFSVGDRKYHIPKTIPHTKKEKKIIKSKSRELEEARSQGRYARIATTPASKAPHQALKIVADYIKKHNRKLYGGMALNAYLPKKEKIYRHAELPDYDFFSPDPWADAVALADQLFQAGFYYTQTKAGIHKGTFKVFADFWPVADITYLPQDLYDQVTTTKQSGFTVVSPAYLQQTLYNIISKPIESPVRWPKVAFRQKLLEQWAAPRFSIKQCRDDFICFGEHPDIHPALQDALQVVYKFAKKKKLIHYGALAYNKYIELGGGMLRLPVYYYELLAENAADHAAQLREEIAQIVNADVLHADIFYFPHKDMNNTTYILYLEIGDLFYPIFTISELTRCIPYKYYGGRYYCSIDYLFYELYQSMFNEETNFYSYNISCLIRYLTFIQQEYYRNNEVSEMDNTPFQRFVTNCRGPFVDVLREEFYSRWLDTAKSTIATTDIIPLGDSITITGIKGRKIRVYPQDLIEPPECRDLAAQDCSYPCVWTDGRCTGIPFTGYAPGQTKTQKIADKGVVNLELPE